MCPVMQLIEKTARIHSISPERGGEPTPEPTGEPPGEPTLEPTPEPGGEPTPEPTPEWGGAPRGECPGEPRG